MRRIAGPRPEAAQRAPAANACHPPRPCVVTGPLFFPERDLPSCKSFNWTRVHMQLLGEERRGGRGKEDKGEGGGNCFYVGFWETSPSRAEPAGRGYCPGDAVVVPRPASSRLTGTRQHCRGFTKPTFITCTGLSK